MDAEDLDHALVTPELSHRTLKWYHYVGDFMNIVKAFIGTNYQALPFAFSQSGLAAGIIGVLIIACLTDHCCQLLIRSKHHLIRKLCEEEAQEGRMSENELLALRRRLERILGYGDIGRHVFGPACYHAIQILVCFTQYTTGIAYCIFIANTLYQIIPYKEYVNSTSIVNVTQTESASSLGVPILNLYNVARYPRSLSPGDEEFFLPNLANYENMVNVSTTTFSPGGNTSMQSLSTEGSTTPESNTSTSAAPNATSMPEPVPFWEPLVDLRYLFLVPLPFFLLTCLIKNMRLLAPFSGIATVALAVGAVSILVYLLIDFSVSSEFEWFNIYTLPVFIGQLTGAFEGIGCVVPIESSMEGNRHVFRYYLHAAVAIVAGILIAYGTLGYLRYGDQVQQLIVENITQVGMGPKFVDITLIISVLFTFPLQTFPVIEVVEDYVFGSQCGLCGRHSPRLEYDEIGTGIQQPEGEQGLLSDASVESKASASVSFHIPSQVPAWKRNILRILIVLSIGGFGVALRDAYAYLGAFTGALGCSLLAFVLPCMIHLQVRSHTMPRVLIAKDIAIIVFAVVASLLAVIVILYRIAVGKVQL